MRSPGIGKADAEEGSVEWAERWRLNIQSAVKGTDFDVKNVCEWLEIGKKHRAWTLITDMNGTHFKNHREFVACEIPWGLSKDPVEFDKLLELAIGKRAAQLETVSEPGQGERTDLTSGNDCEKLTLRSESNLRAINRAPSIVADLYRQGLINQVDAAKLGRKGIDKGEIAAEIARVVEETASLEEKDRRKRINEAARSIAGSKKPTPLETCVKAFAKCEDKSEAIATILKQVPVIATDTGTAVKQVMAIWEKSDEVSRKAMYVWISDQFKS